MTPWLGKHPGGARLLLHYGGEDATVREKTDGSIAQYYFVVQLRILWTLVGGADACSALYFHVQVAWTSFHNNTTMVKKYMGTYHIGHLVEEQREVFKRYYACGV